MIIQHARNTIKTKSVQAKRLHPIPAIGQQKGKDRYFSVIKTPGIPGGVISSVIAVEILIAGAVESAETLHLVDNRMGVNQVHQNPETHSVSRINQGFEFIGSPETGRRGEKTGHLISKRSIIGVLLEGHQLNGVISRIDNPW
jgi:hypothetical protein